MKIQLRGGRSLCGAWLSIVVLAACGRSTSSDAGPKPDGPATIIADGAADARQEQEDVAVSDAQSDMQSDAQDETRDAAVDVAAAMQDAGVESAGDAAIADATLDTTTDTGIDTAITPDGTWLDAMPLDTSSDAWPDAVASRQSVHFTIASQRVGWAVTSADRCGAITIERQSADGTWQPVVLGIPFQCGCECPQPPDSAGLQSLSIGPTLTWDARELAVVTETMKCPTTPGQTQDVPVLRAFPQPVAPGHYRARVAVLNSLPSVCTAQASTGIASCTNFSSSPYPFGTLSAYNACPGDLTARGEFDLPASGDVDAYLLVG